METKITIPLPPITKKNSQRIAVRNGRPFILPSEAYKRYEEAAGWYIRHIEPPITEPVNVQCIYYMPTKRRCDLVNLLEATLDVLVKYHVLADDNAQIVVSHDGSRVLYDKEHPRTEIEIRAVEI